jgi:hypothetical protein
MGFVIFNIVLVIAWILISVYLHREHKRWKAAAVVPQARFEI